MCVLHILSLVQCCFLGTCPQSSALWATYDRLSLTILQTKRSISQYNEPQIDKNSAKSDICTVQCKLYHEMIVAISLPLGTSSCGGQKMAPDAPFDAPYMCCSCQTPRSELSIPAKERKHLSCLVAGTVQRAALRRSDNACFAIVRGVMVLCMRHDRAISCRR
jgi:hypothetical protein